MSGCMIGLRTQATVDSEFFSWFFCIMHAVSWFHMYSNNSIISIDKYSTDFSYVQKKIIWIPCFSGRTNDVEYLDNLNVVYAATLPHIGSIHRRLVCRKNLRLMCRRFCCIDTVRSKYRSCTTRILIYSDRMCIKIQLQRADHTLANSSAAKTDEQVKRSSSALPRIWI